MEFRTFSKWVLTLTGAGGLTLASAAVQPAVGLSSLTQAPLRVMQAPAPLVSRFAADVPAFEFASPIEVGFDTHDAGAWTHANGEAIWRLRVASPGARSLNFALSAFRLPAAGEFNLYDGAGRLRQGPYRTRDGQIRELWTGLVEDEEALLEIRVPESKRGQVIAEFMRVNHGHRSVQSKSRSGSCNVSTACPEANEWTEASRATALITVGGRIQCSAVLLNNTADDGEPLMLTANHCGIGSASDMSAASVVVYWGFDSTTCQNPESGGSMRNSQSGAELLARAARTDFTLIRLDETPAVEHNVYYAGWDASGAAPSRGASTHHPNGDRKRISLFESGLSKRTARIDNNRVESWQVRWTQGVTEPGSSGSGLFNEDGLVVGQLSGGRSECATPQEYDYYGRLDQAWGSAPDANLRPWLDPEGTGSRTHPGMDPFASREFQSNDDVFGILPIDVGTVDLDVLSNDLGEGPLRIVSAAAEHGRVVSDGSVLTYTFPPGVKQDAIVYTVTDRWGNTDSSKVTVEREPSPSASSAGGGGGAMPWWFLVLAVRRRRR